MDACLLCLELNKNLVDFIEAYSPRWQALNITSVVEKHFWPLNTIDTNCWICKSCWQVVDYFHDFYLRIEEAHENFAKVKVKKILDDPEIVIDQTALNDSIGIKEFHAKRNKNYVNQSEVWNEDPLLIRKVTRSESTLSESIILETEPIVTNPDISEPIGFLENYDSNNKTNDSADETTEKQSKHIQNKDLKDSDKFIAEHFKQISCQVCRIPLENFPAMLKHVSTMHNQVGYVICCKKKFFRRSRLVEHLHSHLNPDHFKCTECDKVLSCKYSFETHILRWHCPKDEAFPYFCDICEKSFPKAYLLRKHQLKHLPEEEKKFPCVQCDKFYASSYLLNHHKKLVHLKKFVKVCNICGKSISTSGYYKIHMKKHEGKQPVINCDICGSRMCNITSLKRHKDTQHLGGRKEQPCALCPKVFCSFKTLSNHVNTVHLYKCTICRKTFEDAESLRDHKASHT